METKILRIRLLPVGQADCIFILFPDKSCGIVDCGSTRRGLAHKMALQAIKEYVPKDKPVRFVLATHPDADHCGDIPSLLSLCNHTIEAFYYSGIQRKVRSGVLGGSHLLLPRRARQLENEGKIGVVEIVSAGDSITWKSACKGLSILVLNPEASALPGSPVSAGKSNNSSVVLQITFGESVVLLAGDIEHAAWDRVVGDPDFRAPIVLKASHHGAYNGIPPDKVSKGISSSRWALLSTKSNDSQRPHIDALRVFWGEPTWRIRCTGWSPYCHNEDQEKYPVPTDDSRYPQSLKDILSHANPSDMFDEHSSVLGCCLDNEISVQSDGTVFHQVESKSCDSRRH